MCSLSCTCRVQGINPRGCRVRVLVQGARVALGTGAWAVRRRIPHGHTDGGRRDGAHSFTRASRTERRGVRADICGSFRGPSRTGVANIGCYIDGSCTTPSSRGVVPATGPADAAGSVACGDASSRPVWDRRVGIEAPASPTMDNRRLQYTKKTHKCICPLTYTTDKSHTSEGTRAGCDGPTSILILRSYRSIWNE